MKLNLLIADDSPTHFELIKGYLREYDINIHFAENAKDAIDHIKTYEYDLIITDKNMPGLKQNSHEGGMDLLEYLRMNPIKAEVVMATGYATIDTAIKAMKMGAFDYLIKPYYKDDLVNIIKRVMEYKAFINPENTIHIFKDFQNEVINLFEKATFSDREQYNALLGIRNKIDYFLKMQKNWETIILRQREALSKIASFTEQLKGKNIEDEASISLIEKIIAEADARL